MKLFRALALGGFLCAVAACIGCSKSGDSAVVAKVGDYDITVQEFKDYFENRQLSFASAQDEFNQKKALLDTMVTNRLLAQEAYKRGIDKTDEVNRAVLANKDKFLLDALYYKEIASKAKVTEAEIKDFYDKLQYQVRASHILVASEDTAKMLLDKIKAGGNFEQLAYDYSIDQNAKRNKGDLGYFMWGSMIDEFQEAAFKMQPGEISPPVKTPYGYHLIKVIDRLPNDNRGTYESMRKTIENQLLTHKRRQVTEAYMKQIEEKYAVTIDTVTCQYLAHKREQLYPPEIAEHLPKNDFDIEQLDRNEKELVLATWNGGQVSLGAYLEMIKQVPPQVKPNFDNYDSLKTIIFLLKQEDILATEALKSGLDNDPRYLRKVSLFKDLTMADILKNDSLKLPEPPSDSIQRYYYDTHIDEFSHPAQIHAYEILLTDELKAKNVKQTVKSLAKFRDMAMDMTMRKGKRENGGDLGYIERLQYPEIYDEADKTPVGEIGGPVATGIFFSVFYVADKIAASPKDYLAVKTQIVAKFQQEAKETTINQLIADTRAATKVEIKEDVIWSLIDKSVYTADSTANTHN